MKKIFIALVLVTVTFTTKLSAQYAADALRFSQTNYGSSARFKGMGSAQIGVGGDISSLGGNPAGLGLFTRSEFAFTPEFNQSNLQSNYLNSFYNTKKDVLNINQIGAVFYSPIYKVQGEDAKKGLISGVFGIGYNRNNDFTLENNYKGANSSNSITDYFAQIAGSTIPNDLEEGSLERMAYDNYLISYDNATGNYFPETFAQASQSNMQRKNEVRSGSTSEFNFSAAANISNQFYIGASIALVNIRYNSDAQFEETGLAREFDANGNTTGNNINYKLLYNQNQTTKGSGLNAKIGVIFRPVPELRLGANFQTPTWFQIDDTYTEGLDNRETRRGTSNDKTYDFTYNLTTPLKGSLGASYVIANTAIVSADVDFVDYSSIRFSSADGGDNGTIMDDNNEVKNNYTSAINYRVGAEVKISRLSLRAGLGVNGTPYKDDSSKLFETKFYSGGLGYRVNNYYIDLAYQKTETNNIFTPYTLNDGTEPVANVKNAKNNMFLTIGLRF